ncbi:27455_t:CDS:2 [Racocetra persica]|uniref:27455_t:CDS:1 n=1 Tax=Racocetra persica TaxID=160502 RepID=A0ACA9MCC5_9GLOM|nr:27455_t:CDS:2 [Racocetra persica]
MSLLSSQSKELVSNHDNDRDNNYNYNHNDKNEHTNDPTTDNINIMAVRSEGDDIIEASKKNSKNLSATMLTNVNNIKLRDIFAIWIINRQRLFTIIEDPELIEIIQYLNLTAQLVKANTIKNAIMSLYNSEKRELKASFTNIIS